MSDATATYDPEQPLNAVLAEYLEARRQGTAPTREELLARHPEFATELASFLDGQAALDRVAPPGIGATMPYPPTLADGSTVPYFGDYELLGEIARGGMGVVYRAKQVSLNRVVALKMILAGRLAHESDVLRFRAEAAAAANLDHPNIVPIYEVGDHQGQHYFSMKLVDGGSLSQRLAATPRPPVRELVEVLEAVARAVHYAHQRGILHRDLKPANVLIDSQGQPHVSDFGLAKQVDGDSKLTVSGSIVGTPSYMPPEQAVGEKGLTLAADVYSLGAILYECLAGRPPFKADSVLETLRLVRETEPMRPRAVDAAVNRDLETIALKCLAKQPARRYESAAALADDLRRWLDGIPITARTTTATERALKWVRRRPAVAGLIAAVALSLVGGTVATTLFALDAKEQATQARNAEQQAKEAEGKALQKAEAESAALLVATKAQEKAQAEQKKAEEAQKKEAEALKNETKALAEEQKARKQVESEKNAKDREYTRADGLRLAAEADAARFRDPGLSLLLATAGAKRTPNHLTFNALYAALADCREERTLFPTVNRERTNPGWYVYEGEATFVRYLPGGNRVLAAAGNSLRVWDADAGKSVGEWKGFNMPILAVGVSPDGKRAAVLTNGHAGVRHADGVVYNYTDRVVYVVDLATGIDLLRLRGSKYTMASVEFSPDGSRILTASWDGSARVYDAASGAQVREIKAGEQALLSARFTPDGRTVLTVATNVSKASYGYDADAGGGKEKPATDPAIDPEARPLGQSGHGSGTMSGSLIGSSMVVARVWDIETGKATANCYKLPPELLKFGHVWYPKAAALSPDGKFAAVAFDGEVTVWETATGNTVCSLKGHEGEVAAVAFRPGGKQLATAGADKTIRLWDVAAGVERFRLRGHADAVTGLRFSASGKKFVSWSADRTARVWDADSAAELAVLRGHTGPIRDAEIRSDELRVATAGDSSIRVWTLEPTRMPDLTLAGHAGKVTAIAYSPDGKTFLTSSADQSARLWDAATGKVVREFGDGRPLGEVRTARFSPDGTRIVTAAANRSARVGEKSVGSAVLVWDVATGKQVLALDDLPTGATHAEFTPDGSRILTVGDGSLRIQYQSQDPKAPVKAVTVGELSFNLLSSATTASGIQNLWDAKTGKLVATLFKGSESSFTFHGERTTFHFTPDGRHLLTVNKVSPYEPTLYQTSDGAAVGTFPALSRWGGAVATGLSPDGKIAFVEKQSELALYDTHRRFLIATLKEFPGSIRDFTCSADGKLLAVTAHKSVFVFALPDRKLIATLKGHLAEVTTVAFNPDGLRVLTGSADDTAAVWETQSGRMLSLCKGHAGKLTTVLFRADGRQVATLASDGTAKLWPVDLWPAVAARTPRVLTADEMERYEVAPEGQPRAASGDRIPLSDPPPGVPLPEPFVLPPDRASAEQIAARRAELARIRGLPIGTPTEIAAVRPQAHAFGRQHAGSAEALAAGGMLVKLPSPLDALDAKQIPAAERAPTLPKEVVAVLGESRQRSDADVEGVALSPAGKVVATEGNEYETETRLWDAETLDSRGVIGGYFRGFARDREELYTASDSAVHTWDVSGPQPKEIRKVDLPAAGHVKAVSPDGRFAAGYGKAYDNYWVWDLTAAKPTGRVIHKATTQYNEYRSAVFSPNGDRLALQVGRTILFHNLRDPAMPATDLLPAIKTDARDTYAIRFSPDGSKLAATVGPAVVIWDVSASPKETARLTKKDTYLNGLSFAADGVSLHVHHYGRDGVTWDLAKSHPAEKAAIPQPVGSARGFARTPDERRIYVGLGRSIRRFDKTADRWREPKPLAGHTASVSGVGFAADGRTLYSADESEWLREWQIDGGRFVEKRLAGGFGRRFNVTPDGQTLVGGYYSFSLWDAATLKSRGPSLDRRSSAPVPQSVSADGRWLARSSWDANLRLFDISGPQPRLHATVQQIIKDISIASVALSPDGQLVALVPEQYNDPLPVRVFRVTPGGLQPLSFPHVTGTLLRFSPDGRTLAVANRNSVTLVDLARPAPTTRATIELTQDGYGSNLELIFTGDGMRLVTKRERTIAVWNVADAKKVGGLDLPRSPVSCDVAPDGRYLAVGNLNGTVWILRLP